jgi:Trypsin
MTGRDSCNGDSGGPLVGRKGSGRTSFMYLYGVVSFGGTICDGSSPGDKIIKHFFFLSIALQIVWEIARLMLTFSAKANNCPQGILTTLCVIRNYGRFLWRMLSNILRA